MGEITLDPRSGTVLRAAVERYIQSGEAVGSRELNRDGLPFSPATIRAVMALLEEQGLVSQPHTSAGRVPTSRGYRAYVDTLRQEDVLKTPSLSLEPTTSESLSSRVRACVRAMATATGLVGFAVTAPRDDQRLRHIEFVRMGRGRILALVATEVGVVHHTLLRLEIDYPSSELSRFQDYLCERFVGMTLRAIRAEVHRELDTVRSRHTSLGTQALDLSRQALPSATAQVEVHFGGQHHLLDHREFQHGDQARAVLEEIERRETWISLLDAMLDATGTRVFIGAENAAEGLHECSLVATRVSVDGGFDGTFGVLGPTRLDYRSTIGVLAGVSALVSAVEAPAGASKDGTSNEATKPLNLGDDRSGRWESQ